MNKARKVIEKAKKIGPLYCEDCEARTISPIDDHFKCQRCRRQWNAEGDPIEGARIAVDRSLLERVDALERTLESLADLLGSIRKEAQ